MELVDINYGVDKLIKNCGATLMNEIIHVDKSKQICDDIEIFIVKSMITCFWEVLWVI